MRRFQSISSAVLAAATACLYGAEETARELTKAVEIRSLPIEAARAGIPVRIRGTVTFVLPPGAVFVQDETAGTFFRPAPGPQLRPGDIVEVRGKTHAGSYLPGIALAPYQVTGHGPLPQALPVSFDDLMDGRYHYQRVAIEGVARSVSPEGEGRSILRVAVGSRVVEAWVDSGIDDEHAIVDSRVRVEGLAAGAINRRRQLVQPYLRLRDSREVTIVKPAVREQDIPAVLAADLATFSFGGRHEHRVRIEGVVTARSSGQEVFLRSGQTALGVRFSAPTVVAEGDRIVAVGFTEMGRFSAWLVDARLVQQSPGKPLPPRDIGVPEIMAGTPDADLVSVTAVLTGFFRGENGVTLALEGPGGTLQAHVPSMLEEIPLRSVVRVTGICQVESTTSVILTSRPQTVTLRLRSPGDLTVLKSPPWWTARRLAVALVSLLGAMLVAVLWIVALRRQVRIQTNALQEKIKDEAILEERHRIAREFHDSLEQDLTGLALRLSAAATRALDEKGRKIVEISCGLLARIQAETRNYVSDLREPAENHADFAAALETIAAQRDGIDGVEVRVDFSGPLPALSPAANHHLRMMARESLTNAIKHAHASRIFITVSVVNEALRLQISDDGCGFDVATGTHGHAGHFGCIGMRERSRKIGATIAWRSEPGTGTSVEIILPLPVTTEAARRRPPRSLTRALVGNESQGHPPCPVTPPRS